MIEGKKEKKKLFLRVNNDMYEVGNITYKVVAFIINKFAKKCPQSVYDKYVREESSKSFKEFKKML
jgi:hypothetical protein